MVWYLYSYLVNAKKVILTIGLIIIVIAILLLLSSSSNLFVPYPDQFGGPGPNIPYQSDDPFSSIPDQDLRSYDSPYQIFPDESDDPFSSIPDQDLRSYDSESGD